MADTDIRRGARQNILEARLNQLKEPVQWDSIQGKPTQAADSDKLDGVHLADIRLGQNIFHNPGMRNPVNQRRVSGAISAGSYFFDRWIRNSGTVTVGAGYLTLASGAVIEQRIEGNLLAGLICTISFEVGGTIYHGSGAFPSNNGTVPVVVDGYPNITFGCATGYMFVLIPATSNTSIKRLKCEIGFVSTLHLDPPMDWAVELPKCLWFFRKIYQTEFSGIFTSTSALRASVNFPTPMRIAPSVAAYSARIYTKTYGNGGNPISLEWVASTVSPSGGAILATAAQALYGVSIGDPGALTFTGSAMYIDLSADL